jgi:hypothetical protein
VLCVGVAVPAAAMLDRSTSRPRVHVAAPAKSHSPTADPAHVGAATTSPASHPRIRATTSPKSRIPDPATDPARIDLSTTRPDPASAASDLPVVYPNGCHVFAPQITRARFCVYGDRQATKTVVLIGDSHVAQWFPAFDAAARSDHVKLLYLTKSSCPGETVSVRVWQGNAYYRACDTWRDNAFALIKKQKHVDLVVMGGFSRHQMVERHSNIHITDPRARAREWGAGIRRTVQALGGVAGGFVILRDTPLMKLDSAHCLLSSGGDNKGCQTSYGSASSPLFGQTEQAVAREYANVGTADFTSAFCTSTRCRPVTSTGILRWRDQGHMTTTFARLLAPSVQFMLQRALSGNFTN